MKSFKKALTRSTLLIPLAIPPLRHVSGLRLRQEHVLHEAWYHHQQRRLAEYKSVGQSLSGTAASLFGSAVEVSSGSSSPLLAVGAPSYDLNVSLSGFEFKIIDTGALFVYELQESNQEWNLIWSLPGLDGEQLGDRIAMSSSDYRRIAVRRYQPSSAVEVYDIAPTDTMTDTTLIGNPIAGPAGGNAVAMSLDGSRVAVSSESYSNKTGCVQVLKFNDIVDDWQEMGERIEGDSPNDLFGWRVAFSNTGSRLAISAPSFNSDGMSRRGLVRVYDYDENVTDSWVQVGNDLIGEGQDHKFGYSLDISGDGMLLVVGAPGNDDSALRGVVTAYALFGGNWVQKGQDLEGTDDGDRLGRTIAVSDSGHRIAASSYRHNEDRGHIMVWDLLDADWMKVKEIEGTAVDQRVGFGFQGFSMSDDGEILGFGAVNADNTLDNGLVEVLNEVPPAPSSAPSLTPSTSPTVMASSAPSLVPSVAPVVVPWTIERSGPARIVFSDEMLMEEINIDFIISNRDRRVALFEKTCTTQVPSSIVEVNDTYNQTSKTHGNLSVTLDVIQETVVESNVWTMLSDDTGRLELCLRVDLLLDDTEQTSINFRETILTIDVDLNQGFNVAGIEGSADDPDIIFQNVTVDYNISACHCNGNGDCIDERVGQTSDVFICVSVDSPGVQFANISFLDFIQDSLVFSPIQDSIPNSITSLAVNGSSSVIETRLISAFYDDPSIAVLVEGIAVLSFTNGTRRSLFLTLEPVETDLGFGLSLALDESSSGVQAKFLSLVVTIVATIVAGIF